MTREKILDFFSIVETLQIIGLTVDLLESIFVEANPILWQSIILSGSYRQFFHFVFYFPFAVLLYHVLKHSFFTLMFLCQIFDINFDLKINKLFV